MHLNTKGGPKGTEVPLTRATYVSFYIWLRLSNIVPQINPQEQSFLTKNTLHSK